MQSQKPSKPTADYPLFPHDAGQWAKKIKGKMYYFGSWSKPDEALQKYLDSKDKIVEERNRELEVAARSRDLDRVHPAREWESTSEFVDIVIDDQLRLQDAVNLHLDHVQKLVDNNDLSIRTKLDRKYCSQLMINFFGADQVVNDLKSSDWADLRAEITKGRTAGGISNVISRIKTVMSWLSKNEYINPPRYGTCFDKPSRRKLRLERRKQDLIYTDAEIRLLIQKAEYPMKAIILLGINCGLGNVEVARLEWSHLNLSSGWLDYPRYKTGIDRRVKLWPETIQALQTWKPLRRKWKTENFPNHVFVTKYGNLWTQSETENCEIAKNLRLLEIDLKIKKPNRGFYSFRRMVETIGGNCKDQVAVNGVMGHVDGSMAGVYRLDIPDKRLEAVTNAVRKWLKISELKIFKTKKSA